MLVRWFRRLVHPTPVTTHCEWLTSRRASLVIVRLRQKG
jgi:hypothetical protein